MTTRQPETDRVHWFILAMVILLAAGLRFHALGEDSLWNDEIIQASWARESLGWIYSLLRPSFEAALGVYILHFVRLVGESEFILRFPGTLYGILSLALIFRLGRRLFEPLTGVLAALLLATSAFHLQHSQEVHPYTLVVMLSLLSLDRFVAALRRPALGVWLAWVLATVLSLYTHPFTLFVFAAEIGVAVIVPIAQRLQRVRPLQAKRFLLGAMLIVLLWLPEIVPAMPDLVARSTSQGRVLPSGASAAWVAGALADLKILIQELVLCFSGAPGNALILVTLVVVGVVAAWIDRCRIQLLLCLLVLLLPLMTAPFRSSAALFFPRYFIFMLPVALILAARALAALIQMSYRWVKKLSGDRRAVLVRTAMLIVMSCLILVLNMAPVQAYYRKGTQDWRGLARYLSDNVAEGDAVIQLWLTQPYSLEWYYNPTEGVQVLNGYELRGTSLQLANRAQVWWVFTQHAQHKWLREQVGSSFDISIYHGLSVLRLRDGPRDTYEALAATLVLLELEAQVHTAQRDLYHRLITDLQRKSGRQMAKSCLARGDERMSEGRWKDAQAAYEQATALQPDWGMAQTKLGNAYRNLGRLEDAEASYLRSIGVEPEYVGAYINLGGVYERQGRDYEALELLVTAVEIVPDSAWAHSALGGLYLKLGDSVEALAHLERSVELDPDSVTWMLSLANGYRDLGKRSEAIRVYRQVVVLDPENQTAREALRGLEP